MFTTLRPSGDEAPSWGILEAVLLRMMLWMVSFIDDALGIRWADLAEV